MNKTVQIEKSLVDIVKIVAQAENKGIAEWVTEAIEEKLSKNTGPKNGKTILKRGNFELQISNLK